MQVLRACVDCSTVLVCIRFSVFSVVQCTYNSHCVGMSIAPLISLAYPSCFSLRSSLFLPLSVFACLAVCLSIVRVSVQLSACLCPSLSLSFSLSLSHTHTHTPLFTVSLSGQPPAFLQCGDFVYPLLPGKSPVLHSSGGAYIFSELGETEDDQSRGSVGVVMKGLPSDEMSELDHVSQIWHTFIEKICTRMGKKKGKILFLVVDLITPSWIWGEKIYM